MAKSKKEKEVVEEAPEMALEAGWGTLDDHPLPDTPPEEPEPEKTAKYGYFHAPCGGLAFYIDHEPSPGEVLKPKNVILMDGSPPKPAEGLFCDHCGQGVGPLQFRHVHPVLA